jgi:hypothetical protein
MPDTQQARMRVRQQHRNRVRFVLEIPARITDAGVRIHGVCPNGRAQVRKRLRIGAQRGASRTIVQLWERSGWLNPYRNLFMRAVAIDTFGTTCDDAH